MKNTFLLIVVCLLFVSSSSERTSAAAENWFEIKGPNFTIWANANDGATRTVVWQLEQVRHVAKTLWPWIRVDLPRPMIVLALKDEQSMKTMAPAYWEVKNGVRPVSVWVTAPDRHYIAIRTDTRSPDDVMVNPHTSAYFSYANLALTSSFEVAAPLWLTRGLAGVWSNTLIRNNDVIVGAAIPWHLERLRQRRLPLKAILDASRRSSTMRDAEEQLSFDAHAWGLVHYLMFADEGAHASKLQAFIAALMKGHSPDSAFAASIGNIDEYDRNFAAYVNRGLFSAARFKVDLGLDRERFPTRPMSSSEAAVAKAGFHVAMGRPIEARALLDGALAQDPQSANAISVEAMMLDREGNSDAARTAYARAVELGTTDPYALFRWSMLNISTTDAATRERIERSLASAVELNPSFAAAHASLAEIRAILKRPSPTIVVHMQKAVALEPSNPWHRIIGSRVLARLNATEEARKAAQTALKLADDDPAARKEAERILAMLADK
jgi:tetratricopeptide (TPR) repeat protein